MLNIKSAKKNEKGIALIFTLIMLSLLMVLALSFALDSMFEQKAAYNSASSSSSGFMAQAQLKQVLLLLKSGEANFDSNGYLYSHDSGSATDTDMLISRLPVDGVLAADDVVLDPDSDPDTDDPKVNWNYVKDANDKIIGRTAFVVVPEDKIPLDSLVDDRAVSATLSASCLYPKHNEKDDTETRIGKYVSEINVRAAISPLPDSSGSISTITETLNCKGDTTDSNSGFTNGEYTGSWLSFSSLFSTINTAISGTLSEDDETKFESNLTLTVAEDEEAFWAEASGGDTTIDSSELYNRFDLTRGDWSTSTTHADDLTFIKNVILLDSDGDGVPDINMDAWDGDDSLDDFSVPATLANYSKGLPWLACFGYDTAGTVSDTSLGATFGATIAGVAARRSQIAANLKDYCDTDSIPTSDVDPRLLETTSWLTDVPTFTGNEKTPYVNKLGVKISSTSKESLFIGSNYYVWADIELSLCVGLVNMYEADFTEIIGATVDATVIIATKTGHYSETTHSKTISLTVPFNSGMWNNGHSNLAFEADSQYSISKLLTTTREMRVKVRSVVINRVVLHSMTASGIAYDYVKTLSSTSGDIPLISGAVADTGEVLYGWAVDDPRQNLNSGDWLELTHAKTTDPSTIFSLNYVSGSPDYYEGTANSIGPKPTDDPTAGDGLTADKESSTDPANSQLSTAYIRNAPMESPWELGFIHRGAKWETINLKKYDKTKAFQITTTQITTGKDYIPGGGAYTDGDANILDQVKMTEKAKSPQKINLSSTEPATFNALFYKVKLGCDINNATMSVKSMAGLEATPTGTELTDPPTANAQTTFFGDNIITKYKATANPEERLTRASVVDELLLPQATATPAIAATTDAAQEELIGKIVNLTKVGKQSGDFAIIVLSQTINDIGGAIGDPSITVYKVPADGSAALQVDCEIGNFDVTPDSVPTATWTDDAYGDEITGEQKIMVKINNSASNIITIKSFQYID